MTEAAHRPQPGPQPGDTPSPAPGPNQHNPDAAQAGALLRNARQQQGLHIAALAAAIKVTPAKLEALEAGRIHELLDITFTRALAITVCRVLKTDPAPVLALLPGAPPGSLARVDSGLNTPFRERSRRDDIAAWLPWRHPVLWLAGLLLVAAAAFVLVPSPSGLMPNVPTLDGAATPVMPPSGAGGPTPTIESAVPLATDAAATPGVPSTTPVAVVAAEPPTPTPTPVAAAAVPAAQADASAGSLVVRGLQPTWVQATDSGGKTLLSKLVAAGETVTLTPATPVRLRIGNAKGTEVVFRGQPVIMPVNPGNTATITLP